MSSPLPDRQPRTDAVEASLDAVFSWSYEGELDQLRTLYANALDRQWVAMRDLDWEKGIDREAFSQTFSVGGFPIDKTDWWKNLDPDLRWNVASQSSAFMLSNFLHGEQAVPPPGDGLDEAGGLRVVAQGPAQLTDGPGQDVGADDGLAGHETIEGIFRRIPPAGA